eukprot:scaffold45362_cov34-Phaeocystis_antarctica.AAC.1
MSISHPSSSASLTHTTISIRKECVATRGRSRSSRKGSYLLRYLRVENTTGGALQTSLLSEPVLPSLQRGHSLVYQAECEAHLLPSQRRRRLLQHGQLVGGATTEAALRLHRSDETTARLCAHTPPASPPAPRAVASVLLHGHLDETAADDTGRQGEETDAHQGRDGTHQPTGGRDRVDVAVADL